MGDTKNAIKSLSKITNAQFLELVSQAEPKYTALASKGAKEFFKEKGFEAVENLPDGVTGFYGIAAMIGAQFVDFVTGRNPLDDMGIIERFSMSLGEYAQRNRVKRIHNVTPGWRGLKNGDSPDQFEVRKPEIVQDYYKLNLDYQNFFTWQDFDLKLGWTRENGIGEILSQMFSMVALDRKEMEFSLFFEVLNGALNSQSDPLKEGQVIELDSWTDGAVTDGEIRGLIEVVKNVAEALETAPTYDKFNAAGAVNDAGVGDHVLLIRKGIKSKIENLLGYVYNRDELAFPFKLFVVNDFGGLKPVGDNNEDLQPVYDKNGVVVGYIDATATINGPARWDAANNRWLVNITSGGATADTTFPEEPTSWVDPNADTIAVLAQRGVIFELRQNEMVSRISPNNRGYYTNQWFNEPNNGICYNHTRNLVKITKPSS